MIYISFKILVSIGFLSLGKKPWFLSILHGRWSAEPAEELLQPVKNKMVGWFIKLVVSMDISPTKTWLNVVGGDWNHGFFFDFPEAVGNVIIPE